MASPSFSIAARETPWYRLLLRTPLTTLAIFVARLPDRQRELSLLTLPDVCVAHCAEKLLYDHRRRGAAIADCHSHRCHASQNWKNPLEEIAGARIDGPEIRRRNSAGQENAIGREICQMLRQQAIKRGQTLPQGIQLYRVEIQYDDGKIKETKRLLFAE